MQKIIDLKIYRIIDANFNRAREGLRVCEDVARFILDKKGATKRYKLIRHRLAGLLLVFGSTKVIRGRSVVGDVGRKSVQSELKRKGIRDIFYANSQRVKESVRVLEEFAKLSNSATAEKLKRIRYQIYALEAEVIARISRRNF